MCLILEDVCLGSLMKLYLSMSARICLSDRRSRVAELSAMYSLSVVERAISIYSLLAYVTGQPPNVMTNPMRKLTLLRSCECSLCHIPAKLESTYMSCVKSDAGRMIRPLSFVAKRYLTICLMANS